MKPTQPNHRNQRRRQPGRAGVTMPGGAEQLNLTVSAVEVRMIVEDLERVLEPARSCRDNEVWPPLILTGAHRRAANPATAMFSGIELLAPYPTAAGGGDLLHAALNSVFVTDPPEIRLGHVESGLSRGFRVCTLRMNRFPGWVVARGYSLAIRIQRFDTGVNTAGGEPPCNFGWVLASTTGPIGFQAFMRWRWAQVSGRGHIRQNHLVLGSGKICPTETERDLFHLLRLDYLEPHLREQWAKVYASELNGFKLPEWARGPVVAAKTGRKGSRQ